MFDIVRKVTDKGVLVHYTNSYWHSGSIAPLILHLATTTWGVVSFTPWLLYIQYWIGGKMGHRPSLDALEKKSLSLLGIKPWFTKCAVVEDRNVKVNFTL